MHANWIANTWVEGQDVNTNINPANLDEIVGEYARASRDQALDAIRAARAAFEEWQYATPQMRFDALDLIGSEILERKEELATLLTREEGKTLPEAAGEVARAGAVFKYFAGEALRNAGDRLASVRPGVEAETTREPVGVVGLVTPWNFPIAIPAWKIAPALAYGNCVVFKPAELVPGSGWALAEIISRAGLPEGVFNLVMGAGSVVGAALGESNDVDAVSFTGSTAVGEGLRRQVTARGGRIQLEMGGKNPLLVMDDADLDNAVDCAVNGAFFSTGQRCTASSRLIVDRRIQERFTEAMLDRMQTLRVGDGLDPETDIGPVISESQLRQVNDYLVLSRQEGARVEGGGPVEAATRGHFIRPALLLETDNAMRVNQEEIFGPVASILPVDGFEEGLALANATEFGLSAGICTRSLKLASEFRRRARTGMVMVNLPTAGVDYHIAFGGRKASSYGPREQGAYAREFYTVVKTAYTLPL